MSGEDDDTVTILPKENLSIGGFLLEKEEKFPCLTDGPRHGFEAASRIGPAEICAKGRVQLMWPCVEKTCLEAIGCVIGPFDEFSCRLSFENGAHFGSPLLWNRGLGHQG